MQVYIEGTKKGVNEQLKAGTNPQFTEFNMFNPSGYETRHSFADLPVGTVVKFWLKLDPYGTPIAKSYGQVKGGKIA